MPAAETVARAFLADVWNARDLAAFPRYVSRDVRFHPPRGPPRDYATYLAMATEFQAGFSHLRFTVQHALGDERWVAARLLLEGTNDGPFRGRPATGRRIRVVGQPQFRVEGERIVEFWQLFDELGALHQLGHVPDAGLLGGHAPEGR